MKVSLHLACLAAALLLSGAAPAQNPPTAGGPAKTAAPDQLTPEEKKLIEDFRKKRLLEDQKFRESTLRDGIEVRIGDIGGFRGAQSNSILGYGLVVGLAGTGDSKQTPFTSKLLANALSRWGTMVKAEDLQGKNIAAVTVSATLPAFAAPGRKVDVTVSSIGDAKSLEGGFLLPTQVSAVNDPENAFLMASGPISIGGFEASSGGASSRKNHQTVGRVPEGGDVLKTVQTQFVFEGGKAYFDLQEPDFTTAQRVAQAINDEIPEASAAAVDGATIAILLPDGVGRVQAVAQIESITVRATLPASVVINERTGTIVVGGNVKIGPAIISHGSLQVSIEPDVIVSQPAPLSNGETKVVEVPRVTAQEDQTQIGLISGSASIDDLARILQTLKVSARDIIAIMQALAAQGALKARIKIQ